jgi:ATP-dependent RNA helicase RhlE
MRESFFRRIENMLWLGQNGRVIATPRFYSQTLPATFLMSLPAQSFAEIGLHPILLRNLQQMGYVQPWPIQAQTLGLILQGHDLIALAQTGTGKTAAFVTGIAHHLLSRKPGDADESAARDSRVGTLCASARRRLPIDRTTRLRSLVLCPTRELAQQVGKEAAAIVQRSVLRVAVVYGKVALGPQAAAIARGVDMLIGTPGRLRELIDAGALSLVHIQRVTIDEADRMLDMGFLPQITTILEMVKSERRQVLLFTATMPPAVENLARQFLRDPLRIEVGRHTTPVAHVQQHLVPVHDRDKVGLLLHLLGAASGIDRGRTGPAKEDAHGGRGVLVFCRTKRRVGWVGAALQRHGIATGMIHGDRSQVQRKKALDRFANDELRVLVATDVAARGLHIPAVKTVVNYDLPLEPEEYVHRIGRAAHGLAQAAAIEPAGASASSGARGQAYTFLSPDDRLRWREILRSVREVGESVHAEDVPGFHPLVDVARGRRKRRERDVARQFQRGKSAASPPRRSRKSRPIKKGEKPGKGVVSPVARNSKHSSSDRH